LLQELLTGWGEDANVDGPGVQIDAAVECVLLIVKTHAETSFVGGATS